METEISTEIWYRDGQHQGQRTKTETEKTDRQRVWYARTQRPTARVGYYLFSASSQGDVHSSHPCGRGPLIARSLQYETKRKLTVCSYRARCASAFLSQIGASVRLPAAFCLRNFQNFGCVAKWAVILTSKIEPCALTLRSSSIAR